MLLKETCKDKNNWKLRKKMWAATRWP